MNVNGVRGLFPLKNINSAYDGYYMNLQGEVFSTKRFTTPQKMLGSTQGFGTMKRQIYSFSSTQFRQPRTEHGTVLFANAKRHKDWAKETAVTTDTVAMPAFGDKPKSIFPGMTDRNHAQTLQDGLKAKGYIIGQVQGEALVFGSKPKVHTTLTSVKAEVARLASQSPGTQIVYLKIEGAAVANGLAWV